MLSGPGDGKTMAKEFNVPFTRSRISAQKVQMDPKLAEAWCKNALKTRGKKKREEPGTPNNQLKLDVW